jgi:hypothetical protein
LDLKFAKFRGNVWAPKSKLAENSGICDQILLNNFEVPNIFLGQVYFSESLGCKLVENYDELKNCSFLFQIIEKQSANFYKICTKISEKNHIS